MTYKDSADDGEEGSVAGGGEPKGAGYEFPLEAEADSLEERLRFLHAVAKLWRLAARPDLWPRDDAAGRTPSPAGSPRRAGTHEALDRLPRSRHGDRGARPAGGHEGMIEFDRRRALKGHILELGVSACVEMGRAARSLAALLTAGPELPRARRRARAGSEPSRESEPQPTWEPLLIRLERAIVARRRGRRSARCLPGFVAPVPRRAAAVLPAVRRRQAARGAPRQTALHVLEDLLTRLPRLGLLRETFHLTKLARQMEWNNPPDGRRVSSFDQLFRTALTGVVETLLVAAADWGEDAGPDGPLSGDAVPAGRGVPGTLGAAQPVAAALGAGIGHRRRRLGAGPRGS